MKQAAANGWELLG